MLAVALFSPDAKVRKEGRTLLLEAAPEPLRAMTSLRWLHLMRFPGDLSPLAGLVNLEELNVAGCAVTDLAFVAKMSKLRVLGLRLTGVTDLSPLLGTSIEQLDLSELSRPAAVAVLADAPTLRSVWVSGAVDEEQVAALRARRPDVEIRRS